MRLPVDLIDPLHHIHINGTGRKAMLTSHTHSGTSLYYRLGELKMSCLVRYPHFGGSFVQRFAGRLRDCCIVELLVQTELTTTVYFSIV